MTTRNVVPTGVAVTDYTNIQAAIDASVDGDTILLKEKNAGGTLTHFVVGPRIYPIDLGWLIGADYSILYKQQGELVYLNAEEREAASGFGVGDVGRYTWQMDDYSVWQLTAHTPATWVEVEPSIPKEDWNFTITWPRTNSNGINTCTYEEWFHNSYAQNYTGVFDRYYYLPCLRAMFNVNKTLTFVGETNTTLDWETVTGMDLANGLGTDCPDAGLFTVHNKKNCTFRSIKMQGGWDNIMVLGGLFTVENCHFKAIPEAMYTMTDDNIAFPDHNQSKRWNKPVQSSVKNCTFELCGTGPHMYGGSISVTGNTILSSKRTPYLYGGGGGMIGRGIGTGLPGYWVPAVAGCVECTHCNKDVFSGNSFDYTNMGAIDQGWCSILIMGGVYIIDDPAAANIPVFYENCNITNNTILNGMTTDRLASKGSYPDHILITQDVGNATIRNIVINKNTFTHTVQPILLDVTNYGYSTMSIPMSNILVTGNTFTDNWRSPEVADPAKWDWPVIWLYATAGGQLTNSTFTANNLTNCGCLPDNTPIFYTTEDSLTPGAINHIVGREPLLPGGSTTIEDFLSAILTYDDAPWYNDFAATAIHGRSFLRFSALAAGKHAFLKSQVGKKHTEVVPPRE